MKKLLFILTLGLMLLAACQAQSQVSEVVPTIPSEVIPPTPTPLPEVPVSRIEDVVGIWRMEADFGVYTLELKPNGEVLVLNSESNLEEDTGTFTLEGNLLTWEVSVTEPCLMAATYEVFVIQTDGQPSSLRFVLVGKDDCEARKVLLDGKTISRVP